MQMNSRRVMNVVTNPRALQVGDVVSVPYLIFFSHTGVVVGFDDLTHLPQVASASGKHRLSILQVWEEFSAGLPVTHRGYWSTLPRWEVARRARSLIDRPYDLFNFNCDSFVCIAHGLEPKSQQLDTAVALTTVGLCAFALSQMASRAA